MNILVIDDQAMIRQIHSKMLVDAGHSVQTANNGREGLEMWRKFLPDCPFDLIMTDEEMPEMNGLAMCEALLKEVKAMPIIMVSSLEDINLMTRLMKLGITFFRKPIRADDLIPYLAQVERQVKIQRERDNRKHDHERVEKYLSYRAFQLTLDNDITVHPSVIKYILDFCEANAIPDEVTFRVHFGLEEVLTNSVAHGNLEIDSATFKRDGNFSLWESEIQKRAKAAPYKDRKVLVVVEVEMGRNVTVTVEDGGPGFDHRAILAKITPDDIYQAFGRGLVMLNSVADSLQFNDRGNKVTMVFERHE